MPELCSGSIIGIWNGGNKVIVGDTQSGCLNSILNMKKMHVEQQDFVLRVLFVKYVFNGLLNMMKLEFGEEKQKNKEIEQKLENSYRRPS